MVQGAEYFGSLHRYCSTDARDADHRMVKRIIEDEQLSPANVRRAHDEIIASEMFRHSPQLARFLRFIVLSS